MLFLCSSKLMIMTYEATWIMLLLTNLFGGIMIFVVLYILRNGKRKRKIITYSDWHGQKENGPTLELPEGIVLPDGKTETKA